MKLRPSFLLFFLFFSSLACSSGDSSGNVLKVTINNHVFRVEIADTPAKRERGYMERENIGADEGMLFVFPGDRKVSFWMENTPTPLSIAYIDSRGIIREIHSLEPYSRKAVQSRVSVRYALEVPRGRFEELGIKPGDKLEVPEGALPSAVE